MIFKRGKFYWYEFEFRGRRHRSTTGVLVGKGVRGEESPKEKAKQVEASKRTELALGKAGIAKRPPAQRFADYADNWIETYVKSHCKHSTIRGYKLVLETHLKPAFSGKRLDEITRQDITDLINKKLASESARDKLMSRGTVRNILAPLRGMLNQAVDAGILASNPANRIGRYMKEKKAVQSNRLKMDPLSREEVVTLLDTAGHFGYDTYALFMCALRTGMRLGELFGLQWPDLDFNSRFVQVQRNWVRNRLETPKNNQLRRIDMSKKLSETLQELRRRRKVLFFTVRVEAEQLCNAGESEEKIRSRLGLKHGCPPELIGTIIRTKGEEMPAWVFINEEGQPLDQNNWRRRVFEKVLEKAELRRITPHDMRHTFASLLLQQGESPQYVKQQMGHHSIQITVDIYGHLIPGSNRQAVDRLDDMPVAATATA